MLKVYPTLHKHFKGYCSEPNIIVLFVYMKFRFTLSYRDLEEMTVMRGAFIDHSTLQRRVKGFAKLIEQRVRKRKRPVNGSWRMDETYIKLNGKWVYLYRAVDKYGFTIEFLLRAKRDGIAAKAFFRKAFKQHGRPEKITVDKSGSNKCAVDFFNEDLEKKKQYEIRQVKYLNNIVEQDHRFIKKRTRIMLGFKSFYSASETLSGIENIRIIQKGQIKGQKPKQSAFENLVELMA
ncbi:MAG: IS6 family transposase [Alphaproteobacteria bacterium]|nr:IS6 family transposase [Alphaproteobacteria bacterium]